LAMTQEALNKYCRDLSPSGVIVADATFVREVPAGLTVYSVPITRLAKENLGRDLFANIVSLGVINKLAGAVSRESLEQAVLDRVPKGTEDANRKALALGYAAV